MKASFLRLALLLVAVAAVPARGVIIIDDFSTFQSVSQNCATIGTPVGATVLGGGILGGERDVRLNITSCPGVGDLQVLVTSYFHSADAGVRGTSLAAWDGTDGTGLVVDPIGLGGVDLTEGGTQDAFEVLLQQADLNSLLVFEVFTNGSNSSKFTLNLVGGAFNSNLVIPYASFVPNLGSGADFTNVGAITMLIDGTLVSSLDVIVDFLGTTSTLTAIKTGALLIDSDGDGLIEAGETIRYTITITNPDDDQNATTLGVLFNDTPDPNTNLVVGSVTTTQGSVTTGNGGGDTDVEVDIGNVLDGAIITITFDVVVKPGSIDPLCNQGFITHAFERSIGIGFNLPTDDPSTTDPNDPTCLPVAYCGDGFFDPTDEQCDDGNLNNNDTCSNDCTQGCGNGIVNTGETCDDGNLNDNDDCSNNCTAGCGNGILNTGETCDDGNLNDNDDCSNNCTAGCGNGILNTGETCDDGNLNDNDNCSNNCTAGCGNGILNPGEACDDGNLNDNDACSNNCTQGCGNGILNTGEVCDDGNLNDNDTCSNNCTAGCGNGIVNTGETCDDGNLNDNDDCSNNCTAGCGNGILNPGEACDDGNLNDNDACSNNCTQGCGNGILNTGEQCDDGNLVNNDGCTNTCTTPRCGDSIVQAGEQCDDGNAVNNDGCSNSCALPTCGDGILQPGEQCDDNNNVGGDGCSPTCNTEICGNNVLDPNEVCDGVANAACPPGSNCLPDCTCEVVSALCGNGILDDGEQCDGAANAACDGGVCRPNCTCDNGEIPTVSEWGMAILTLLLLTAAKLRFTERRTV